MIISDKIMQISPIFLSILLIGYLILVELGNEKIKKIMKPIIIVLIIIFLIIAIASVYNTYSHIR